MASNQHDVCTICLERPKNPKSLPTCTHAFCSQCLSDYVTRHKSEDTIACPTCSLVCPMRDLQIDVRKEAGNRGLTAGKKCTLCSYKNVDCKAEWSCENCEDTYLCPGCAAAHRKQSFFKTHRVISLVSRVSYKPGSCQKHGGRPLILLCISCDKTACVVCATVQHADHELVDIADFMNQTSDDLGCLASASSVVASIQAELGEVRKKEEEVIAAVVDQYDLIKKALEKRKEELISEVRSITGVKQIDMEVATLAEKLEDALNQGQAVLARDIHDAEHFRAANVIKDEVAKMRSDAVASVAKAKDMLQGVFVPKYTPVLPDLTLGTITGAMDGKVRVPPLISSRNNPPIQLQLGNKCTINPCYKVGPFDCHIDKPNSPDEGILVASSPDGRLNRLYTTQRGKWSNTPALDSCATQGYDLANAIYNHVNHTRNPKDVISNGDGTFAVMKQGYRQASDMITYQLLPRIETYQNGEDKLSGKDVTGLSGHHDPIAFTQNKSGNYIIISKCQNSLKVSVVKPDASLLADVQVPKELSAMDKSSLNIVCCKSKDLVLARDSKNANVLALSLEVSCDVSKISAGSVGKPVHRLEPRAPIVSPLEDHSILDICGSDTKVYLCLQSTEAAAEASSIKLFEAALEEDGWRYTHIPLLGPDRKAFDTLGKKESLKLGTCGEGGKTLVCMVYSLIPEAELKDVNTPGINIICVYAQLQ